MIRCCRALRWMPLALCVFTPVSVFVTYGLAVAKDHVSPLWPYISDTGTVAPESCVFALFMNAVAYSLSAIVYLRYCEVSEFLKIDSAVRIKPSWNKAATCLGFLSCFGLDLVANFQETNEFWIHIVGALTCFFSGTLYFLVQTAFTYKMQPEAKALLWTRIAFTFLNVLFVVGTFAPLKAALLNFRGHDMLKWTAKDGGFAYHAISTFSEWFLVFSFCGYMCTLFWDFRKFRIEPPKIKFLDLEKVKTEDLQSQNLDSCKEDSGKHVWI